MTCILHPGDHEFIRHDTFVFYKLAACIPVSRLIIDLESGRFEQREAMRPEVLARIYSGLLSSRHTNRKIRKHLLQLTGEAAV